MRICGKPLSDELTTETALLSDLMILFDSAQDISTLYLRLSMFPHSLAHAISCMQNLERTIYEVIVVPARIIV